MKCRRGQLLIGVLLLAVTLAVYWQVRHFDYVDLDDSDYAYNNPQVQAGWTSEGFVWAFKTSLQRHWHPLTWLSLMTDCRLFGCAPGPHHLMNLFLHLANVLLLFSLLTRMTGEVFKSAFVAALFALHPLHVESVAWISSRKDVLSTFFCFLAVWSYVLYCEKPKAISYYTAALVLYALGLMAKPMLVTLPAVLLLIDFWPLDRFELISPTRGGHPETERRMRTKAFLVWEKIPFCLIAVTSCVISFMSIRGDAPLSASRFHGETPAVANVLLSYFTYLKKTIRPVDLATPYLPLGAAPTHEIAGIAFLLLAVSIVALTLWRRCPYLLMGWSIYLVTLLPVIGIVQNGPQIIADRYTYIPLIGLFIMVGWGIPDISSKWRRSKPLLMGLSATVLVLAALSTYMQIQHWSNSSAFFLHAIKLMPDHASAHLGLGVALAREGNRKEAIRHFQEALRIEPDNAEAHNDLGLALLSEGKNKEAVEQLQLALQNNLEHAEVHNNLGVALVFEGRNMEAVAQFQAAVQLKPGYAEAHNNLGKILLMVGRNKEAIEQFQVALQLRPGFAEAFNNLQRALWSAETGRIE